MKFDLASKRVFIGNDITVQVTAADGETITSVETRFDNGVVSNANLPADTVSYRVVLVAMGTAGQGITHEVVATGRSAAGIQQRAVLHWTDAQ